MISLAAIDLDGTLLHDDMTMDDYSRDVIRAAAQKGMKIVIATGRGWPSAKHTAEELGLDTPVICYSGAWIMDGATGKPILQKNIPRDVALSILQRAKSENWCLFYSMDDHIYAKDPPLSEEAFRKYGTGKVIAAGSQFYVPDGEPTRLIIAEPDKRKRNEIQKQIEDEFGNVISAVYPGDIFLDVRSRDIGKAKALGFLCDQWHIDPSEMVAFGNTENDVSMLKMAGQSYAVANAEMAAKKAATDLCPSNNDDGVAKVLETLI